MEKVYKIANLYVATLRAIYFIHQNNHWTTKGSTFYGDHLLFERLYDASKGDADMAAEKMIGLFGEKALDFELQNSFMNKIVSKYAGLDGNPAKMSLTIVKDFLQLSESVYKTIENEGSMTLGLDDMIMAIASKNEESCYLLQQTLDSE